MSHYAIRGECLDPIELGSKLTVKIGEETRTVVVTMCTGPHPDEDEEIIEQIVKKEGAQ